MRVLATNHRQARGLTERAAERGPKTEDTSTAFHFYIEERSTGDTFAGHDLCFSFNKEPTHLSERDTSAIDMLPSFLTILENTGEK